VGVEDLERRGVRENQQLDDRHDEDRASVARSRTTKHLGVRQKRMRRIDLSCTP
jgi:hypothetical protein